MNAPPVHFPPAKLAKMRTINPVLADALEAWPIKDEAGHPVMEFADFHRLLAENQPPSQQAVVEPLGLGDMIGAVATPIAAALGLDCVDKETKQLKPDSGCAQRKAKANEVGRKIGEALAEAKSAVQDLVRYRGSRRKPK